ncbi:MAG: hypothetical protein ABIR47_06950 [Candidatus Kapaibacterium sp.]
MNIKSEQGRSFIIDILEEAPGSYRSSITVLDNVTVPPVSWGYEVESLAISAGESFETSLKLIVAYLKDVDSNDMISDIHNPCNCPFVTEMDQNAIVSKLALGIVVRVN